MKLVLKILLGFVFLAIGLCCVLWLGSNSSFNENLQKAKQGNPEAQESVATAYLNGWFGVSKNLDKALFWYRKAANQNNADAHYRLGLIYWSGEGTVNSRDLATDHFSAALCGKKYEAAELLALLNREQAPNSFALTVGSSKSNEDRQYLADAYSYYLFAKAKGVFSEPDRLSIKDSAENYLTLEEKEQSFTKAKQLESDLDCGLKVYDYNDVYITYDERSCGSGGCWLSISEKGRVLGADPVTAAPKISLSKNEVSIEHRLYGGQSGSSKEVVSVDFSNWLKLEKAILNE